jgi:hypothetical protein
VKERISEDESRRALAAVVVFGLLFAGACVMFVVLAAGDLLG